jgi:hypothetical protein
VPEDRQRFFVIGARDGTDFHFPVATHAAPHGLKAANVNQLSGPNEQLEVALIIAILSLR